MHKSVSGIAFRKHWNVVLFLQCRILVCSGGRTMRSAADTSFIVIIIEICVFVNCEKCFKIHLLFLEMIFNNFSSIIYSIHKRTHVKMSNPATYSKKALFGGSQNCLCFCLVERFPSWRTGGA